jgi:chemotaxis protein MotA
MDRASVIGFLGGLAVIGGTILASGVPLSTFWNWPSVFCVLGGSLAAMLICAPWRNLRGILGVILKVIFNTDEPDGGLIEQILFFAESARRDGLLAMETRIREDHSPFLVMGLQMVVDGTSPEAVEQVLRAEMNATASRHREGRHLLEQLGKFAPAFGMIGTLLGLVIMLRNMNDPSAIGPGMAVALLTTLYGAVVANLICLPMADKLSLLQRREQRSLELLLRGVLYIQAGDHPKIIEQKLLVFVPRSAREPASKAA